MSAPTVGSILEGARPQRASSLRSRVLPTSTRTSRERRCAVVGVLPPRRRIDVPS